MLLKLYSIFFIIDIIDKIEYKFKNGVLLEWLKKLIIVTKNLFECYFIIEVSYIELLYITKPMFIGIKFEISKETSYIYDSSAKPIKKLRPS